MCDPSNEIIWPGRRSSRQQQNELMKPLSPLLSADLIESDTDFSLHADLPGVEDLDITMQNGMITIKAERKFVHKEDLDTLHTRERSYGKVQRSFAIPRNANANAAEARFLDGVLSITFPKLQPTIGSTSSGRKLEIKRGDIGSSSIQKS
jgi:HSP20 family protein